MTSRPDWLSLVEDSQRVALLDLLDSSPRFRREDAEHMLLAHGGWPSTAEAAARIAEVIAYLTEGAANATER